ncbi:Uncharacterised protein [Staphylococcus microti]|uniref:Uncharacterized protein n=1 Tax=Staphylococcus microti TaxID=569857 RepID=A0A380GUN0_9STAP|nr:Uncharacterised protein [Staphylococcus microti]
MVSFIIALKRLLSALWEAVNLPIAIGISRPSSIGG